MTRFLLFLVLKESSDVADLSPPAQFRTLSDNDDIDDDGDDDDETENVKGKKPFCRSVSVGGSAIRDWCRHASADAKNRKRNSSYDQSTSSLDGATAKESRGDFLSRPSPGNFL